ncbi:cell division ATP-binding protein FtsE [Candidatus Falkowbacteria bacterium HGW-Falkowbacteria-1]|uniref:Cell division ATP-binding protein FtsE n=1 Tax=Candidatus Falkowbacteria bacterium HGW-Falkowbacteria-1 TaxID=2013768 RepID=A0A2N2E8Q3_9BACT|nr:MAG: cell division ATP-binding protein FtsE [Candidatus Falkowbacteria bacterium HGW-Falkowbacteria-1]
MIKLIGVNKIYKNKVKVLDDVNLSVKAGEFVSVVGQSGTGKTTLVKILTGEEKVSSGKVWVGDWDITNIGKAEVPYLRRQIGVIFQDFKLLDKKTLGENISFALEVCGKSPSKIKRIVPSVMKIVGLAGKENRYPHEVSGGEQQRAAIARALVHQPKILLADEPTGNLDAINANEIIDLLLKINNFGTTIILVTHNRDVVNGLNRRVVTVDAGKIVSDRAHGKYII